MSYIYIYIVLCIQMTLCDYEVCDNMYLIKYTIQYTVYIVTQKQYLVYMQVQCTNDIYIYLYTTFYNIIYRYISQHTL